MIPFNRRRTTTPNRDLYGYGYNDYFGQQQLNPYGMNSISASAGYQDDQQYELPVQTPGANDRFGQDVKLPTYQMPRYAPPPDFADSLRKIRQPGANRLAYQKLVDEGSPKIKISKWDKIGSILAAAGTTFATGDVRQGMALGRSAFEDAQARNDDEHERKIRGYDKLAAMEDRDKDDEIKILENQQNEYWRKRSAASDDEKFELDRKATEEQLESSREARARANYISYEDDTDGYTYLAKRDGSGERIKIGKTGKTTKEQIEAVRLEEQAREDVRWPNRKKELEIQGQNQQSAARIGADSRETIQGMRGEQQLAAIRERNKATIAKAAASVKPGDVNGGVWSEVAETWSKDPELKNYAMDDLLESIKTGAGPDIITAKKDVPFKSSYGGFVTEGDTADEIRIKNKLRALLAEAYAKRGIKVPTAPATPNAPAAPGKGGDNDPLKIR